MKLNLLPQTVRVGVKSRSAWVASILLVLLGIGAAAAIMITSDQADKDSADQLAAIRPKADKAYTTSTDADADMLKSADVIRDTNLATAMMAHNADYPAMYEDLFHYNPPFFRLTSITGTPIDENTANITMTGTLTTYQQYADLMLMLLRNPRVISVSRAGYNDSDLQVPPLVPDDQIGKPRKPGSAPIPDDQLQRLTYFESQPVSTGYSGAGNYGVEGQREREAMPGDSLITVTMVAKYKLQTPSPMATLQSSGGAAASSSPSLPGVPGGMLPPQAGSGGGVTPSTTPSAPPTGSTKSSKKGAADEAD